MPPPNMQTFIETKTDQLSRNSVNLLNGNILSEEYVQLCNTIQDT